MKTTAAFILVALAVMGPPVVAYTVTPPPRESPHGPADGRTDEGLPVPVPALAGLLAVTLGVAALRSRI